ncbi:uncharacterized protein LOC114292938 [Camellia sinensis]|uniref:uncharacterized protein LOC114292938 n=1 Tax=Camellia sinensis TaxID=4442 RepID=UPI001035DF28|nr:uncharacterized protein LOC114292938 [Camellia sinensis]
MKIYAFEIAAGRKADVLPECQSLIEELSASHSTDLQQRAYELQAVISLDAHAVESIMPLDASCEDIEIAFKKLRRWNRPKMSSWKDESKMNQVDGNILSSFCEERSFLFSLGPNVGLSRQCASLHTRLGGTASFSGGSQLSTICLVLSYRELSINYMANTKRLQPVSTLLAALLVKSDELRDLAYTQHHWFSNHGFEEKKLKINVHRPVGTRVVFDDEGNTLPPLATLADVKSGDDSVQLDKDTVSKRYAEMREELKQHDKEDKLLDRERRKEKRMKQKMKLKRGRKEEEDDEGEEDLSGSDGEATRNRANKRSKKYFDSDSDDAERKRDNDKLAIKADSISLAEQEELALKLLSSMHS